jgi:hypothetical protein
MSDKKEQDSSIQSIERRGLLKMLPAAALIPSVAKMFPTSTLDASQERPASEGDDVSATQLFAARKSIDFRAILTPYSIPIGEASGDHFFSNHVFSDKEYWTDRLSVIAKDGYNAVVWMGPSELFAFWPDGGGGHLLLRHKEFPEAREISADKNEEIIAQMKWLFRTVKDLGMMNFLHTHVIWYTKAFGRAHGLDHPMPVSPTLIYFHNEGYGRSKTGPVPSPPVDEAFRFDEGPGAWRQGLWITAVRSLYVSIITPTFQMQSIHEMSGLAACRESE